MGPIYCDTPCIFKDFVQNCNAATLGKLFLMVAVLFFNKAFFTFLIKICEKSEMKLEPCQTSKIELLEEVVSDLKLLTIFAEESILDV